MVLCLQMIREETEHFLDLRNETDNKNWLARKNFCDNFKVESEMILSLSLAYQHQE